MIKILKKYQTWNKNRGKMYLVRYEDTETGEIKTTEFTEIEYKAFINNKGINDKGKHLKPVCGDCRWHIHEDIDDGYICTNPDSDYIADWTEKDDWCNHWEGKTE